MPKRTGLGRGLDALLGDLGGDGEREVLLCDVQDLKPNPFQPRKGVEEELEELARSLKEKGLLQPLLVRRKGDGYEIIAGERRWRAAIRAGLKRVPVMVRDVTDREALELALVENLQRRDLNPLEEAEAYKRLIEEFGYTQEEVARRVGKERSSVANALRLLKLPPEAKQALRDGRITAGHARAILAAPTPEVQSALLKRILTEGLSVREAERVATPKASPKKAPVLDPDLQILLEELQRILGTRIRLRLSGKGGRLEVEFYSLEDLERIIAIIKEGGSR